MNRHIDAEQLINDLKAVPDPIGYPVDWIIAFIEAEPAVDIVRCKECKCYDRGACKRWHDDVGFWENVNADDFCSYGERSE